MLSHVKSKWLYWRHSGMAAKLEVWEVWRYESSGKLVAKRPFYHLGNAPANAVTLPRSIDLNRPIVIPLNRDMTLSREGAHRIRAATKLEATPYRVEIEATQSSFRIIRHWNVHHLPQKTSDPTAPLEQRIDLSPAEGHTKEEDEYLGARGPHWTSFLTGLIGLIYVFEDRMLGGALLALAIAIAVFTRRGQDQERLAEVSAAKARLRERAAEKLSAALASLEVWAQFDGVSFENAVAEVFHRQGYTVAHTPRSSDQGVDLFLERDGKTIAVQCKSHKKAVGVSAVRELIGSMASFPQVDDAILVSLYDFSRPARELAKQQNISLYSISRDFLGTEARL